MGTDNGKPTNMSDRKLWRKIAYVFRSIRVQLTLWYVVTTTATFALFGGLLYSTIAKMVPVEAQKNLPNVALQISLLIFSILLFIIIGGYGFAIRAMHPVHVITRTAQEIGRTDLSRRFHLQRHDELGALAATFDEMLDRLEALVTRQRQFTADASHELRTPLSILSIATSRALSQWSSPENYKQALAMIKVYQQEFSIIQAETEHMTQLVNDLLLLARADMEFTIRTSQEIDLSEVLLEVVERLAVLAQQRSIELTFGELPELLVQGDRLLLTLMVTNLIDNALKYTTGVGAQVTIGGGIVSRGEHEGNLVWIEDDGPGIAEEDQLHLFERFYRVDVARSLLPNMEDHTMSSGSGLGLAIVQWVVQVHGGEIHLSSTVGLGSRFEFWLPTANTDVRQAD